MLITKKIKHSVKMDKKESSGLSAFVERPVPTENEVASFERVVEREVRHSEIDSNLSEIYKDKKGKLIDVKKMKVKKGKALIIRIFNKLILTGILLLAAYFCYFYFFVRGNDMSGLEFKISAPEKIVAGEEFSYTISYANPTKFAMSQIRLELQYPEKFIFLSASQTPVSNNDGFTLPDLPSGATQSLTIKGMIISELDSVNIISGSLSYIPINFSSEFKKESSSATTIDSIGFQVSVDTPASAFINQDNELDISFFDVQNNYLGDFNVSIITPTGASLRLDNSANGIASSSLIALPITEFKVSEAGNLNWLISGLSATSLHEKMSFLYEFKEQPSSADIVVQFSKRLEDGKKYIFLEKTISPELIKSDLNLTLFLNGSKNNDSASFGDTLNYSLTYNNKGENSFKDAVIMVSLDGQFLDWSSFVSDRDGDIRTGKMIVWTKKDFPALAEIKPGDEGEINFSIKIKDYQADDFGKNLQISAYSQYGVNNQESSGGKNKSNVIETKINSDLMLNEQIRYFDDDNAPVGSGPLPPKVGEKSSFKVFWKVTNNLHALRNTEVVLNLPANILWEEKTNFSTGTVYYDSAKHAVIWNIGKMPVSLYQADASFYISATPSSDDINKILILSPGSTVSALDDETQAIISRKTEPKTTKLEDDDIAGLNNSGRVE